MDSVQVPFDHGSSLAGHTIPVLELTPGQAFALDIGGGRLLVFRVEHLDEVHRHPPEETDEGPSHHRVRLAARSVGTPFVP